MRLILLVATAALLAACQSSAAHRPSTLGHQPQWSSPGLSDPLGFCVHEELCRAALGYAHV